MDRREAAKLVAIGAAGVAIGQVLPRFGRNAKITDTKYTVSANGQDRSLEIECYISPNRAKVDVYHYHSLLGEFKDSNYFPGSLTIEGLPTYLFDDGLLNTTELTFVDQVTRKTILTENKEFLKGGDLLPQILGNIIDSRKRDIRDGDMAPGDFYEKPSGLGVWWHNGVVYTTKDIDSLTSNGKSCEELWEKMSRILA